MPQRSDQQVQQRCHVLRAQGVRVSIRGWLLAIEGGKRPSAVFSQRLGPRRIQSNNSRRTRLGSTSSMFFTRPPPLSGTVKSK